MITFLLNLVIHNFIFLVCNFLIFLLYFLLFLGKTRKKTKLYLIYPLLSVFPLYPPKSLAFISYTIYSDVLDCCVGIVHSFSIVWLEEMKIIWTSQSTNLTKDWSFFHFVWMYTKLCRAVSLLWYCSFLSMSLEKMRKTHFF